MVTAPRLTGQALRSSFLLPVRRGFVQVAAVLLAFTTPASAQSVDPTRPHRTVETAHFRVTYTPELEPLAQHAAQVAENAYAMMREQVGRAPSGRIDLLLSDASDVTNGFAMAVPSNRITVFVNPPVEELSLQNFRDWLDLVITHELAHIFHMESSGALGRFVRGIFGRVSLGWPVFPAASMPDWASEGLAVEIESLSGVGRLHGSYHEMVVRTAVLEDAFDPIDRISHQSAKWPGGQRAYIYGAHFLDYITRTRGADARTNIVQKTGASILPPEFAVDLIGKQATGTSFNTLWREWKHDLTRAYAPVFDSLRSAGITQTERIAGAGRIARHSRISPDGKLLAFVEETGREVTHTRVVDIQTNRTAWTRRRTGIGNSSWMPNGSLLTSQVQFDGAYRTFSDLYTHAPNGESRLTKRARLQDPDIDRAGTRIVAVQNDAGTTRLVLLSPDGRDLRAITAYDPNVHWSEPRWSPDGTRIAVAQWQRGNYDIVVIDTAGQTLMRFSEDAAIDAAPAWSPDGRFVLFWSDRTGIPNIFAVDVTRAPQILQVTNVLTGAYDPEVSPDARHVYMSVYHADGFYIERADFDPATWRPAAPPRAASYARSDCPEIRARGDAAQVRAAVDTSAADASQIRAATDSATLKATACHVPTPAPDVSVSPARAYSPLGTMRPYYWLPLAYDVTFAGTFVGVSTSGRDLLGRHSYAADIAVDPSNGRTAGALSYSYAGIDRFLLGVSLVRDWDYLGRFRAIRQEGDTSIVNGIEREDIAQATASFLHRRVRSTASLTVGAELVRRRRIVADSAHLQFTIPTDKLWAPIARIAFANTRTPPHAISPQNGIALQLAARKRFDLLENSNRGYAEITTWNSAYRAFDIGAFADVVAAARFSGIIRDGNGATPAEIGGAPGVPINLGFASIGDNTTLLPVRGFVEGDRFGNRAWSASFETRIPIAFPARGLGTWPLFLDKLSTAVFVDAGNASCSDDIARLFVCPDDPELLAAVGTEILADVAIGFIPPFRARVGIAQPFSGPRTGARAYVAVGHAF